MDPGRIWKRFAARFQPSSKDAAVWVFLEPSGEPSDARRRAEHDLRHLGGHLYGLRKLHPSCVYLPYRGTRFLADQPDCRKYYDIHDLEFKIEKNTSDDLPGAFVYRDHAVKKWWEGTGELTKKKTTFPTTRFSVVMRPAS